VSQLGDTVDRMPRPRRQDYAGATHHVTQRGNDSARVFDGDPDYMLYLGLLAEATRRHGWEVYSYCLMPNHVHLVLRTPQPTLSRGMAMLSGRYASARNRRLHATGHVFEGPFHSRLIETDAHLKTALGYVALNPVRGRLCGHPDEWRWSAHAELCGAASPIPFILCNDPLGCFHASASRAVNAYVRFVEKQLDGARAGVDADESSWFGENRGQPEG
jgi:REP element-mobilizing transposase RayT